MHYAARVRSLVVTPTYQEGENIAEFLQRVRTAVPEADILVVDDSSPDGTAELARSIGSELGHIEVHQRPAKTGLGAAYREGLAMGLERGYEIIVQMDADLSHDPSDLPKLLQAVEDGADMAIGSRYVPGGSVPHWPLYRRALSRYGNQYASVMLGMHIADATAGFRAYKADTLKAVDVGGTQAMGYGFQIELAYRVWRWGARIVEVPVIFPDRVRGISKMTWSIMVEELRLVTWWGVRDRVRSARRDGHHEKG